MLEAKCTPTGLVVSYRGENPSGRVPDLTVQAHLKWRLQEWLSSANGSTTALFSRATN